MVKRLYDAATLKFLGIAVMLRKHSGDTWHPRYDENGEIYCWIRDRY